MLITTINGVGNAIELIYVLIVLLHAPILIIGHIQKKYKHIY